MTQPADRITLEVKFPLADGRTLVQGPLAYNQDGLATQHNADFMRDPRFLEAYRVGMENGRPGTQVEWRAHDTEKYDLLVSGLRVDVKTTMQQHDGSWRLRLPKLRNSFGALYQYSKDYAADCEVIVLCGLYPDGREPDLYLWSSAGLPTHIRIIAGVSHLAALDDWSLLTVPAPLPLSPALPLSA